MRVRTTMLSLASFSEFPTFTNYKIRITFLFIRNVVQAKGLRWQSYK